MKNISFVSIFLLIVSLLISSCEFNGFHLKKDKAKEPDQMSQLILRVQTLETEKNLLSKENQKLREAQAASSQESGIDYLYVALKSIQHNLQQNNPNAEITKKFNAEMGSIKELLASKAYIEANDKINSLLDSLVKSVGKSKTNKISSSVNTNKSVVSAGHNLIELRERLDNITDPAIKNQSEVESSELLYSRALELAKRGNNQKSEELAFTGIQNLKKYLSGAVRKQSSISSKIIEPPPALFGHRVSTVKSDLNEKKQVSKETKQVKTRVKEKVNINEASSAELQGSLGIDKDVAEGIIWYRDNISKFSMKEEIKLVPEMNDDIYYIIENYILLK